MQSTKITHVSAREILDSRGNPTVEAVVALSSGAVASAAVPSGASTGAFEALELRDGDKKRYRGLGVLGAVTNVKGAIANALKGKHIHSQEQLDHIMLELDGTENKSKLGANAILGVSLAYCRASAIERRLPLYEHIAHLAGTEKMPLRIPTAMFNVLNGGKHSDSGLSVQEFKIIPRMEGSFAERLRAGSEVFHALKGILEREHHSSGVGDEGGFSPHLKSNQQALEFIMRAIKEAGYEPGAEVALGLDVAANSFYDEKQQQYLLEPEGLSLGREELVGLYREWLEKYNIISIEDGLQEEDWQGWAQMQQDLLAVQTSALGSDQLMLIGDDLLVTNTRRLQKAIENKSCNSVLIKVNQIGTLTETLECMELARKNAMRTIISHRSGETTDDFIADLAVGARADYMKSGSLSRGERICKYNRLLKIEEELS
ncbi:MAG TPA: phosphopyruvate hydratase [Candidatus Moranbacteria bacterium]|nr:phosphopyruvate hydratase [Candidatus Moranbacteria bacterium]